MTPPKDGPRDWDKELAEVDKLIAGLPTAPQPPAAPARKGPGAVQELTTRRASQGRRDLFAMWLWLLLAGVLGSALAWFWPYSRECGVPLYGYLGAIAIFAASGICSTIWTWRMQKPVLHTLSIAMMFGAAFLGAREVLPRIGYAKQGASFQCAAPAPAPAPAAPVGSAKIDSVPAAAAPPAAPGVTLPGAPAPATAPPPAAAPQPAPAGQAKAPKP